MYAYVVKELPKLLSKIFEQLDTSRASIFGHSMGGHGALTIYLKNLDKYKSVSAYSPITNPINCLWGQKAFSNYLDSNKSDWEEYDATGQIEANSLCNGATSHLNSSGRGSACNGSNGNVTSAAVTRTTEESGNNEGLFIHGGMKGMESHHSIQREAALNKFHLKRKDRCYDKKVRYQSRKTLAEQRPQVKGQFVRQVLADPSSSSL